MDSLLPRFSDQEIVAARSAKNPVDPRRPYAYLLERERTADGRVVPTATIFLSNRECPFRCLMCDLWKNTTNDVVPLGAIPEQIDFALARLDDARWIKLYNSGNFFDPRAIARDDYRSIAQRVRDFEGVIVENHPKLCTQHCVRFRDMLQPRLEVALGLETIHPRVLPTLNKQMTLDDFARAVEFLLQNEISVRTFILLKPPFLTESEGVRWAVRSLRFAFSLGVSCCCVIATRANNGIMETLQDQGRFVPPALASLEKVAERGIRLSQRQFAGRGRVFVDLWEVERLFPCPRCGPSRRDRLHQMNLSQQVLPRVACDCERSLDGGEDAERKSDP